MSTAIRGSGFMDMYIYLPGSRSHAKNVEDRDKWMRNETDAMPPLYMMCGLESAPYTSFGTRDIVDMYYKESLYTGPGKML